MIKSDVKPKQTNKQTNTNYAKAYTKLSTRRFTFQVYTAIDYFRFRQIV